MRSSADRGRGWAITLALALVAAGPVAGAVAQDTAPEQPPAAPYTVMIAKTTTTKQSVQAKLGSYCLPNATFTGGTCHTAQYPLPNVPVVKVSKGEQITLLFKVPVSYLTFYTTRVDAKTKAEVPTGNGEGELITKTKKRWRVTLPKGLTSASTIVGVFVTYVNANDSFEFGINLR